MKIQIKRAGFYFSVHTKSLNCFKMQENLLIDTLKSFKELTEEDKQECKKIFDRPLSPKQQDNKYIKFTTEILQKFSRETRIKPCFLTFRLISLHTSYSALIFSLCGIFESFHLVIYAAVLEDAKVPEKDKFISDILGNVINNELPKLKCFSMQFVLLQNNLINQSVVRIFSQMQHSIDNDLLFIADSKYWRHSMVHNPYAENACFEILNSSISAENIEEIFKKYKRIASIKNLDYLEQFASDYYKLSRRLLAAESSSIVLHLCTLERLDNFENIIRRHMKAYEEQKVTRKLIFQLLRALIIIFDR
ncbi:uncharacterized protein LOC108034807 [Drosophila biarmipes]|uniref:uncharacterized protein LOC108034807 n=1 Tax=Drosophila biarmipes TaxID=125945 RepID=UPI0007E6A22F|nr:uncharacterized protein LOC108034807 [Drosophila biarmipes]